MIIRLAVLFLMFCCIAPPAVRAQAPASQPAGLTLHPKVRPLPLTQTGPFVELSDGGLLCVRGGNTLTSHDEGVTWNARAMFPGTQLDARPEQGLLRTRSGSIVLVFLDDHDKRWKWDNEKNTADGKVWLHVWAARSLDDGQTWTDLQKIQDGYSGAVRDVIEAENGNLITPVTRYLPEHSRHSTMPYVSTDAGKSWHETTLLDVGGRGHHDGSTEATCVQLRDGRVWMLLRTNLDRFWQAFSGDDGLSWSGFGPTDIDASSSPAMVRRLGSGRLMLAWNRLYPEGQTTVERRAGNHSEHAASWYRSELSVAFSADEGKHWSPAIVVARRPGQRISYPYLFERRPGVVWITTMQGGLKIALNEADFAGSGN